MEGSLATSGALASTEPRAAPSYQTSARLWGLVGAVSATALAALAAVALAQVARGAVARGTGTLIGVVALRWLLATVLDEWGERSAVRLRTRARASVVEHLAVPRREGERGRGDLALAIDHASSSPALERLKVSAGVSLAGAAVVFWAAGWLPLLIIAVLLVAAVPVYQRAGRRSQAMAQQYQERRATLESRQLEVLQHAPELRALGAIRYGANEIAAISDSEHVLALRGVRIALRSSLVTEFLGGVSIGLVAMVVGFALLDGHISLVRALVAVLVTSELFVQVRRYGVEFHRREDAERARATLRTTRVTESAPLHEELVIARDLVTDANDESVSLVVHRGDRVSITGPSGVGKTTLLHTLLGWRAARSGEVLRAHTPLGYVAVESALVSGSLRDNLTLGVTMSDRTVRLCLESLGLDGARFGDLDAALLHDGRGLSTGERVRLVLARALLADVTLVVLDDVAGVLDLDARRALRHTLDQRPDVAVIEASVDTPLLHNATLRFELRP